MTNAISKDAVYFTFKYTEAIASRDNGIKSIKVSVNDFDLTFNCSENSRCQVGDPLYFTFQESKNQQFNCFGFSKTQLKTMKVVAKVSCLINGSESESDHQVICDTDKVGSGKLYSLRVILKGFKFEVQCSQSFDSYAQASSSLEDKVSELSVALFTTSPPEILNPQIPSTGAWNFSSWLMSWVS